MTCRPDVAEAIDNARSVSGAEDSARRQRRHTFQTVRAIVLAVVRELPDDMSLAELRDELEISEHQHGED